MKKRKNTFLKKSFHDQNDIEKKNFGEKDWKLSLIHQNDGLDELITIMYGFFWFWEVFGVLLVNFFVQVWGRAY